MKKKKNINLTPKVDLPTADPWFEDLIRSTEYSLNILPGVGGCVTGHDGIFGRNAFLLSMNKERNTCSRTRRRHLRGLASFLSNLERGGGCVAVESWVVGRCHSWFLPATYGILTWDDDESRFEKASNCHPDLTGWRPL